ncbi:MAG: DNA mismatch repair endonuclease MutL [Chloroflexi bacterium]|nr:MAG: DNA mismatch repair endonuclease MutL [Chloroflexota bacterium]MBL1196854.1 DNA mismatch repair endonuclease MutL [Chloroflexota bacterium]NOH14150.1 DNA mismatch repair endonuclease MutL [Chloroflexota bacterium]
MPIQILPDEVASQIAAGEVVERPASVVKELVENSLDAGASYISITIEGAGQKLIEVADDGVGISPDQLELALSRHATSKLHNAADLQHIATLGFRGEALASIASVSRFSIVSRPKDSEAGAQLQVDGGEAGTLEPIGAPAGTVVRVEDLFYNVPARRKFLKKDATERRQIDALVTRYALAYPNVRFQLRQENRSSLQTSGNGDAREVLAALYGADIARQMLEVNADYDEVKLTGFISPTGVTRGNRREITFFVNGRWVQDYTLTAALVQAYHTMLMVGRYPVAVVFLQVDPELVDVNVHPAKSEVRFQQRDQIFSSVQRATRRALLAYTPVPTMDFNAQTRWTPAEPQTYQQRTVGPAWDMAGEASGEEQDQEETTETQTPLPRSDVPLLRLVGQVGSAYLVAEGPDGLYLIDQHAAHERVLFERFMQQLKEQVNAIPSQALLEPVTVELSSQETRLLEDQLSVMQSLGFGVEPFGPDTFILRAMPALLLGSDPMEALRVVIEDFEEDETPLQDQIEAKVIARVCKRAAVKAGQNLSQEEQRALLRDLENSKSPRTCPHGRPTMIHLSIDLLEGQFGRKGAR